MQGSLLVANNPEGVRKGLGSQGDYITDRLAKPVYSRGDPCGRPICIKLTTCEWIPRRGGGGVERGGDPCGRPRSCSRGRPPGSQQRRATPSIPCGRPRCLGLLHAGSPPRSSPARATTRVPAPTNTTPHFLPLHHFSVSTFLG